ERVLPRARARQDPLIRVRRKAIGPAEHHVLEEVREPRLARFDLISRTRLDGNLERHDVGEACFDDNDAQPVAEGGFGGGEGKEGHGVEAVRSGAAGQQPPSGSYSLAATAIPMA